MRDRRSLKSKYSSVKVLEVTVLTLNLSLQAAAGRILARDAVGSADLAVGRGWD